MTTDHRNSAGAASNNAQPTDIDSTHSDKSPPPDPSSGIEPTVKTSNAAPADIFKSRSSLFKLLELLSLVTQRVDALTEIVELNSKRIKKLKARK